MSAGGRKPVIAVLGGSVCNERTFRIAESVGEGIAARGGILICGGRTGVMEASCRGAKNRGGLTIGVLPGSDKSAGNRYLDVILPTGMGNARNVIIVSAADAAIAIDGSHGTLSEIAFCLKLGIPLVGISTWRIDSAIVEASDPLDAVAKAFDLARKGGA